MEPQWQQQMQRQQQQIRRQQEQMRQWQEQTRQRQEQTQRQQEETRRRAMAWDWLQKQQAKAGKPKTALQLGGKDPLAKVERQASASRQKLAAGRLTGTQFQAQAKLAPRATPNPRTGARPPARSKRATRAFWFGLSLSIVFGGMASSFVASFTSEAESFVAFLIVLAIGLLLTAKKIRRIRSEG